MDTCPLHGEACPQWRAIVEDDAAQLSQAVTA